MIVAAWIVWRFVEPPCRRAIYRLADRPLAIVARLGTP
jgi:peptidoglycan/LPS O-acetylase OafA/YrhL